MGSPAPAPASGVLIADDTGFIKKGRRSAGVQRQYTGTSGKIDNCQLEVFLAYATSRGHALIDRELYLPVAWTDDPDRCAEAGIPAETEFATKPELAARMLERVHVTGALRGWFTATRQPLRHRPRQPHTHLSCISAPAPGHSRMPA